MLISKFGEKEVGSCLSCVAFWFCKRRDAFGEFESRSFWFVSFDARKGEGERGTTNRIPQPGSMPGMQQKV